MGGAGSSGRFSVRGGGHGKQRARSVRGGGPWQAADAQRPRGPEGRAERRGPLYLIFGQNLISLTRKRGARSGRKLVRFCTAL